MSGSGADRIALLLAEGHAHRLATQLAIHEAREQLAPLRSVAGFVGGMARLVSRGSTAGKVAGVLTRLGAGYPWTASTLAVAAWRLLRRHPAATLAAVGAGAAAWWLLRPSMPVTDGERGGEGAAADAGA